MITLFIGLPRQEWPSMLSRSLISLELVQKFESLSWSQTSNKYRQRKFDKSLELQRG